MFQVDAGVRLRGSFFLVFQNFITIPCENNGKTFLLGAVDDFQNEIDSVKRLVFF